MMTSHREYIFLGGGCGSIILLDRLKIHDLKIVNRNDIHDMLFQSMSAIYRPLFILYIADWENRFFAEWGFVAAIPRVATGKNVHPKMAVQ